MAVNDATLPTAQGFYEDWIEIHNNSGAAVDLAGWYLTDDPADLRKWQFPSTAATSPLPDGGYLLVFADNSEDAVIGTELHASFKLGSGGEFLALVEPDGETVAYQYNPEFPPQTADISYGIDAGTGLHAYFASPTPGSANGQAIADAVQFSVRSRTFTSPFNLVLSVASPATSIRYTLDGSIPTSSSPLYGSPIPISATTRVRARSFKSGLVNGPVVSETYLHLASDAAAFASEIPVVVIDNFGQGEVPAPDSVTRQPAQLMIFEPVNGVCSLTNAPQVASRAGLKRRGESTLRSTASKPNIAVETWGEVDEEGQSIQPLGMPADSDWILYAPWTIDTAIIRNPFIYEVSNEAGQYAVRTRFVEVFLNYDDAGGSISESDDYYGVYVLMEKIKRGPDRVDVAELTDSMNTEPDISGGYIWKRDKIESLSDPDNFAAAGQTIPTQVGGRGFQYDDPSGTELTDTQKGWFTNHLNAIHAEVPNGNYESSIDVRSFVDHHILNVFANNADGLSASTFYHKDRNGLVRMGPIWDFDRSMGCDNDARASDPEVWSLATDPLFFFHSTGPLWFSSLSYDPEFWIVWTDRWQAMREGPLSDAAMVARIEGYRTEITNAAIRNYTRWSGVLSASEWSGKVDVMKNHVLTRAGWIDDQLIDPPVFNHAGGLVSSGFQLAISGPQAKYYRLNGPDPRAVGGSPAGTAYTVPISITSNTLVKCRSWNGSSFTRAPGTWPWSALSEVMLVVNPAPLAITEIMYHPRPPSGAAELAYTTSDFEFIEIHNTGGSACSLVGVRFLDGVDFDFTYGNASTLAAGGYGVVVRNLAAFKARYADWASRNVLGSYAGRLSNGNERLKLGYATTNMLPLVSFDYEDDWYPATDGEGFALVLNDPRSDPATWDSKQAWRPSSSPDGSPGQANPAPAYPQGSLVINEVLSHQDTDNPGDWIELHNTTGSAINIGGWFLSDSRGNLKKYAIPGGTQIPANGYLVFTEHDHFGSAFALSEHGDAVYLS
ncbi:MAG: CotH kinase family protein, partial [Verrucomicrobia bacterium]|nr:CotH kinase family protein [Verrucomicrobiota bacterium]